MTVRPPPPPPSPRSVPPPPPPPRPRVRDVGELLSEPELAFVGAMRDAGLAPDLAGDELLRVAALIRPADAADSVSRRIDLLEAYYAAAGEPSISRARRSVDRFFMQREGDAVTAKQLVARIAELAPELGTIVLERVGGTSDGPLVLRAGEHLAALLDDYEESLETGDIDLRELEEARQRATMVTLRGLMQATNTLLDRHEVRERFVAVLSDEAREVYVAAPLTEAIDLARAGHLEDDVESVVELGCW